MNSEDNTKEGDVGSSYNNKKDDRGINKGYEIFRILLDILGFF